MYQKHQLIILSLNGTVQYTRFKTIQNPELGFSLSVTHHTQMNQNIFFPTILVNASLWLLL